MLRILGPMELAGKHEWYELTLLHGAVEVEVDGVKKKLKSGGTARYQADKSHAIRNIGKTEAKAPLVVIHR